MNAILWKVTILDLILFTSIISLHRNEFGIFFFKANKYNWGKYELDILKNTCRKFSEFCYIEYIIISCTFIKQIQIYYTYEPTVKFSFTC